MRGIATSIITDKKKYVGTVVELRNFQGQDVLIENMLADRIGKGVFLAGNGVVEVWNFQAFEIGREKSSCLSNCCFASTENLLHKKRSNSYENTGQLLCGWPVFHIACLSKAYYFFVDIVVA